MTEATTLEQTGSRRLAAIIAAQFDCVRPGDAMAVRDAIDLVCLLDDLRMEGGHDELAGVPLIRRLRSHAARRI